MNVTEFIRPNGGRQEHVFIIAPELESFFTENNVEVSYEHDNVNMVFLYAKLLGAYTASGEDAVKLIKLVPHTQTITVGLTQLKAVVEDYLRKSSDGHQIH